MRSFYLFIISAIFICSLSAQNTHVARHTAADVTGNLVSIGKRYFYLESLRYYCCADSVNLVGCDDNGNVLFKYNPSFSSWMSSKVNVKIKSTPDKCLLFSWGSSTSCDLAGYTDYITKVDTLGNEVFNRSVIRTVDFLPSIIDFVGLADSSSIFCTKDTIYKMNKFGQIVSKTKYTNSPIHSIEMLSNGNVFISSGLTPPYCTELTTSLSSINQQTCAVPIIKLKAGNLNSYMGQTYSGELWRFNSNFSQATASQQFCGDFFLRGDSVFIVGTTPNGLNPYYTILNSSFVPVYSHTSALSNYSPTGIAYNLSKVKVIGYGKSSTQPEMSFSAFYNLNLLGVISSQPDLAVVNASVVSWSYDVSSFKYYINCNLNVMVKNIGQQNINSFYLNNFTPMSWCDVIFHKAYNVNIAPGDSAIVQTGPFLITYNPMIYNSVPGSTITAMPCLFSSVPNGQLDSDISNDSFCKTFTVGYVGIDENTKSDLNIIISPNPFNNELKIESSEPILNYKLMDVFGKILFAGNADNKTFNLKTENLIQGIYFLKVETEKGIITKKIVKE
jgi:hypothetical protein